MRRLIRVEAGYGRGQEYVKGRRGVLPTGATVTVLCHQYLRGGRDGPGPWKVSLVGVGGFEPPASWPQTRRSSLTELHPEPYPS